VDGARAQASAALTLLPLENWDVSMVPFVQSAGMDRIPLSLLHTPLLCQEAESRGWNNWAELIAGGGISGSQLSFHWCLEFIRQLDPPGLAIEAAAYANGWLEFPGRRKPTALEILAIRTREDGRHVTNTQGETTLDAAERTFMSIAGKIPIADWTSQMFLSIVPDALLRMSFSSGRLPKRVLNCMLNHGAKTWRDLLSYDRKALMEIPNFGETSFSAIRDSVGPAILAMATERTKSGTPLLDRIREWISKTRHGDERHAQIIESRLGLGPNDGEIPTLEELGSRFHVTRERIRQIEKKAWEAMLATLPALADAGEALSQRIRGAHGLLHVQDMLSDQLIGSLASSRTTFIALVNLGWVTEARIWKSGDQVYMSVLDDEQTNSLLRDLKEHIAKADEDTDLEKWCTAHEPISKIDREVAIKHIMTALTLPDGHPIIKANRGQRIRGEILDLLNESPAPMHFRDIARRVIVNQDDLDGTRVVQGLLPSIPGILLLSMGCYGTRRHFPEMDGVAHDIIQAAIEIMTSGAHDLERDWAMHALAPMVDELADPPCCLDPYRLHAILCTKPDLFIDTGRLTVRLNLSHGNQNAEQGSHGKSATRRQRHLLAIEILEVAGAPMDATALQERVRQQRDLKDIHELTVQYSDLLVILHDDRIGLVPRDLPGDPGVRSCVADAVVDILSSRGWSIGYDVAVGIAPIPKFIPALPPEDLRAILLQDGRFLKRPLGTRAALSSWDDDRTNPPAETLLELAECLDEGFTTKQMQTAVQEVFVETPSAQAIVKILRGTLRWMQTPSGQWLRTPRTNP